MTGARSVLRYVVAASACAIPPKRRPATWRAKRGRPVVARKDDYRQRYTVERSFAWLGNFRRLLIRWERLFSVYRSGFAFAVMLLCVRRATALA
jgi:transposase